jgi:hypothetical protein
MRGLRRYHRLAAVTLALISITATAYGADSLRVTATWAGSTHAEALHVQVTNATAEPLSIWEDALPWKNPARLLILAKAPGMEPLRAVYLPHDKFLQPEVTLKPGETLDGLVDMTHHLKDVPLALRKGRVVVFWYYAPNDAAGKPLGEYGGWLRVGLTAEAGTP